MCVPCVTDSVNHEKSVQADPENHEVCALIGSAHLLMDLANREGSALIDPAIPASMDSLGRDWNALTDSVCDGWCVLNDPASHGEKSVAQYH